MSKYVRILVLIIIVAIIAYLGWYSYNNMSTVSIAEIINTPQDYAGKDVVVSGEVTNRMSMPVLKIGYYKLKDETGEITVISSKALPVIGSKLTISGTVNEAFALGDIQVLVIVENK